MKTAEGLGDAVSKMPQSKWGTFCNKLDLMTLRFYEGFEGKAQKLRQKINNPETYNAGLVIKDIDKLVTCVAKKKKKGKSIERYSAALLMSKLALGKICKERLTLDTAYVESLIQQIDEILCDSKSGATFEELFQVGLQQLQDIICERTQQ